MTSIDTTVKRWLRGLAVAALAAGAIAVVPAAPAAAAAGPVAAAPPVQCVGTGTDGNRLQMVYAYEAGTPNRFAEREPHIRLAAWVAQQNVNDSARREGAQRWLKFVTSATGCQVNIITIQVPAGSTNADFRAWRATLQGFGLTANNRNYVVFAESLTSCAYTDVVDVPHDLSPGTSNLNNNYAMWTSISPGCYGGHTVTHEFAHSVRGMRQGMPNWDGDWHCSDGFETLCGENGTSWACPDPMAERLLDCNRDDYFGIYPQGSWLPTHWNVAYDSLYLAAGSSTTTQTTIPALQPQLLSAVDVEGTSIAFSWTPTVNPIGSNWSLEYQILRNGTVVTTVPGWKTSARVTGLATNSTASYTVRSRLTYNGVTRTSANSVALSVTTNSNSAAAGAVETGATLVFNNDLLHSDGRNLAMDLFAFDPNDNAPIKQWFYNSSLNQRWKLTTATGGTYTVTSAVTNKCLSPLGGATTAGTPIVQVTCNGTAAQRWTFTVLAGLTYQIRTAAGTCIGSQNNGTTSDTVLVLATCSTTQPSHRWTANRVA
ncbi:RICIN domain-containing protein [Micromonospora sp. NPDC049101]|uniref:RICIN domain-containing protein n=1 Tax=Micromonospora sp. NPDC049101 TaxID=3155032 RepID=UPI003411E9BF